MYNERYPNHPQKFRVAFCCSQISPIWLCPTQKM